LRVPTLQKNMPRRASPLPLVALALALPRPAAGLVAFHRPLFADGMILQRGAGARVWGDKATGPVTVVVAAPNGTRLARATSGLPGAGGGWQLVLPAVAASGSTTVTATDGHGTATLAGVAFGDVLLCGGQSNMGYGMCGALSPTQSPGEAMASLAPVRYYFEHGSRPGGGAPTADCNGVPCTTPNGTWFVAHGNSTGGNVGGASAVCMLTASALFKKLGGAVPVGAVE